MSTVEVTVEMSLTIFQASHCSYITYNDIITHSLYNYGVCVCTLTCLILVTSGNVLYSQIPGNEIPLSLLYSGCHNITVATVNECGLSAFLSAQVNQPPGKALHVLLIIYGLCYIRCVSVMALYVLVWEVLILHASLYNLLTCVVLIKVW